MKRDASNIRSLLLLLWGESVPVPDCSRYELLEHLRLLGESGLVVLTPDAQEFARLASDEARWAAVLADVESAGLDAAPWPVLLAMLRKRWTEMSAGTWPDDTPVSARCTA